MRVIRRTLIIVARQAYDRDAVRLRHLKPGHVSADETRIGDAAGAHTQRSPRRDRPGLRVQRATYYICLTCERP